MVLYKETSYHCRYLDRLKQEQEKQPQPYSNAGREAVAQKLLSAHLAGRCMGKGAANKGTRTHEIKVRSGRLSFASNGLLIFSGAYGSRSFPKQDHHIILNPTTGEEVRLVTPRGSVHGVFFNPSVPHQYFLLWSGLEARTFRYRIIALDGNSKNNIAGAGSSPSCCWKQVDEDDDSQFSYQPRLQTPPVSMDGFLYWMVGKTYLKMGHDHAASLDANSIDIFYHNCSESIMSFDTRTEKFRVMGHPGDHEKWCKEDPFHSRMHLVEMRGGRTRGSSSSLCLCEGSLIDWTIKIWILNSEGGGEARSWMQWRTVVVMNLNRQPYHPYFIYEKDTVEFQPVAIINGDLYLKWDEGSPFAYNLRTGAIKKFDGGFSHIPEWKYQQDMYVYVPCLLPIGNCQSEIWM